MEAFGVVYREPQLLQQHLVAGVPRQHQLIEARVGPREAVQLHVAALSDVQRRVVPVEGDASRAGEEFQQQAPLSVVKLTHCAPQPLDAVVTLVEVYIIPCTGNIQLEHNSAAYHERPTHVA